MSLIARPVYAYLDSLQTSNMTKEEKPSVGMMNQTNIIPSDPWERVKLHRQVLENRRMALENAHSACSIFERLGELDVMNKRLIADYVRASLIYK
jgi:hypothetical protein